MPQVTPYIFSLIAVTALIAGTGSILLYGEERRYRKLLKAHENLYTRARVLENLAEAADESVPHAVISVDPRGLICGCNSAGGELFGFLPEDIRGHSIFELIVLKDEASRVFDHDPGASRAERRVEAVYSDGTPFPVWMRVTRTGDDDDARFRFIFENVESRRTHGRLQAENRALRAALDSTGLAVALLDAQGRVIRLSRTCADLIEVSTSHAMGRLFWELFHPTEDWGSIRSAFEQARSGLAPTLPKPQWISRTQRVIPLDWLTLKASFNSSGDLVHIVALAAIAVEATSEPEQQSSLRIIGRVLGRAAGHLENLLSTINGYSELVLHEMAPPNPLRKDVEQIFAASQSASRTMHQLLTFSGNRLTLLEPLDLNALITGLNGRLNAQLSLPDGSGSVFGNKEALEEALLILAEYAGGVNEGGDGLRIATEVTRINEIRSTIAGELDSGDYVNLKVSLGKTLDSEARAHLFEPFHPAAHAPAQSPAGMATVYGIIRNCGGGISFSEQAEQGTTLEILLPSAMEGTLDERPARKRAAARA